MACCGGSSSVNKSRVVTQQVVGRTAKAKKKSVAVQRIRQNRSINIQRQRIVVDNQKCQHCGHLTMVVNIAGRERYQCSNPNCRIIVK